MNWLPTRRHILALGGAAAASAGLPSIARAQRVPDLRIAAIFPAASGLSRIRTSLNDFTGDGGRFGSLVAEQQIGDLADAQGIFLKVYQANAPTPTSAIRAAERLIELEQPHAFLTGVGEGQLEAVLPIAEQAGIPVFNIGTTDDSFRNANCSRLLFHMEASDAMYLDAIVEWSAAQGHRRWFIVHENTAHGEDVRARALRAIAKLGQGGEAVGAAATAIEQPIYFNEIEQARRAGTDAVLVCLNAVDQIAFIGQADQVQAGFATVPLSDPVSQTRDYLLGMRDMARSYAPRQRFQLWDTTLTENGAGAFNERYMARFSEVVDPTGWASYSAVKIIYETMVATGSTEPDAIVSHLESGAEFDLFKGPGTSFRPWDHQLRQPLYLVGGDYELDLSQYEILPLDARIAVGAVAGIAPPNGPTDNPVAWLDRYGDGPGDTTCAL